MSFTVQNRDCYLKMLTLTDEAVKTQARYSVPNHTVLYLQLMFGRNEPLEYLQDTTMNLIRYKEISFRVLTQ